MIKAIDWQKDKVIILDQSLLPFEVRYIECSDYREVAEAIKSLRIRGAPAIGIAAAMGIALAAQAIEAEDAEELIKGLDPAFTEMMKTRPTAVNIRWAIERIKGMLTVNQDKKVPELKGMLITEAKRILEEDIEVNRAIGRFGAELIKDGYTILTHCNAGTLATGGYGTATAAMFVAAEQGKRIHVYVDETRPVLQGARLTSWELIQAGIPVTLIPDNAAGAIMKKGEIDIVIVGTDRTVRNGDVANKIGTYSVAVLAKENNIPFYVAAPLSSIDLTIPSGEDIPIEERDPSEVTHIRGKIISKDDKKIGLVQIAPDGVKAKNYAFDVTPARYITGIITEKGIFKPSEIKDIK
ncbi:MAG: S-methyl-5-thioribose-1-phosphate isomerase [Thermodesulfovibrionales bacterium]